MSEINAANRAERPKPGPKGRVLEPYARDILLMHRQGKSMRDIVNWLSAPSRSVAITRQAVHAWLTARIKKLVKLNATYEHTGVGGPFQESGVEWVPRPLETATGPDPPRPGSLRPAPAPRSSTEHLAKLFVDSEFRVDEIDIKRAKNPFNIRT